MNRDFVNDCSSVRDFLMRYYKRMSRDIASWGNDFIERKVSSYATELHDFGYCHISKHDSMTGREVYYRGAKT